MAKTIKRLSGPTQLTASAVTQYTVPALTKTVIRNIYLSNNSASSVNVTISIGADASGTRTIDTMAIAANSMYPIYGPIVMETTEILQAKASTTLVVTMTMDGEEITLG